MRDLAHQLEELAPQLAWPPTPPLADSVAARIEAAPAYRPRPARLRVAVGALLVAVALVAATLVLSPGARRAAADLLGLGDIHITTGPRSALPSPPIPAIATPLDLGRPVTAAQASQRIGFAVRIPARADFAQPDAVYFSTPPPAGEVSLAYLPRPDLPAAAQTGVGLLVTEFRAGIASGYFAKLAGPDTIIETVTVHGSNGYWLSGAPHGVLYQDDRGEVFGDTLRLATNTLIWQAGPLTFRIEGDIDKARALAIAESIS